MSPSQAQPDGARSKSAAPSLALTGLTAVTPSAVLKNTTITIRDGRICQIGPALPSRTPTLDLSGSLALPAFIDTHTHGAMLFSLTGGIFDPAAGSFVDDDACWHHGLPIYLRTLASTGVGTVCPGVWATRIPKLQRSLRVLADYISSESNAREAARVHGVLLEAPFFNPRMAGAQNPKAALAPGIETFEQLNESGCVRLVNVVPDYGEPSFALIEYLAARGIMPGAGHTDATAAQFREALRRGLKYAIHFTNGPTGGSYKPFEGGGVIEAVLQSDCYAELISDLYHVNPAYMRDIISRKGHERIIAVTDQMFATGTRTVRRFNLAGNEGEVSENRRYARVVGKPNTLFSSLLTMDVAFGNLLSLLTRQTEGVWVRRHEALPFEKALVSVAKMCASNAASLLGLDSASQSPTGALCEGYRADLVIGRLTGSPGQYQFHVEHLFLDGHQVPVTRPTEQDTLAILGRLR